MLFLLPLWWRQERWSRLLAGCVLALVHLLLVVLGRPSLPLLLLHELARLVSIQLGTENPCSAVL